MSAVDLTGFTQSSIGLVEYTKPDTVTWGITDYQVVITLIPNSSGHLGRIRYKINNSEELGNQEIKKIARDLEKEIKSLYSKEFFEEHSEIWSLSGSTLICVEDQNGNTATSVCGEGRSAGILFQLRDYL